MRQIYTCYKQIKTNISLIMVLFLKYNMFPAVKDEDSDMDVPDDGGSDSDLEESRPSKPRPSRNGVMAGKLF